MRRSARTVMSVVAVLGAAALWSGEAVAQVPPTDGGTPPANEEMAATVRTENGRRVYVASTTIEVRGEIQRPYAFSVSGRSSLGYSYFEAPIHFIREIVDAVRRAPF